MTSTLVLTAVNVENFSWTCHLFEVQGFIISADDMYPFFCNLQPQTPIHKHAVIPINTDFLYISQD